MTLLCFYSRIAPPFSAGPIPPPPFDKAPPPISPSPPPFTLAKPSYAIFLSYDWSIDRGTVISFPGLSIYKMNKILLEEKSKLFSYIFTKMHDKIFFKFFTNLFRSEFRKPCLAGLASSCRPHGDAVWLHSSPPSW